ncbi:MAG: ribonuclease E/G, partial [Gammaproteobacteria bacterium]
MKRILLNATQTEETRVAIVDGQYLYDLDIESVAQNKRKSNVYKGTVTRVEASLEAAFIDYGANRHGFLPLKEIARSLFPEGGGKRTIQQALKEGQQLVVQVEKEERGNKGAALTTQVSLAGRYLVLMPRTEGSGGISRKVESRDRDELRETMNGVEIPADMSAIARTMALGRSEEELQWDLNYLLDLWNSITQAAETRQAPFLIYQESNIVSRTIRDHLRNDVSDVIIDDPAVYAEAVEFMQQLMPHNLEKLKLYEDTIPLFTRYQIESQIETAHQRTVTLRSGGSIVIDHTEALTSIDINSARATQGSDIEETAFRTNMEAAEEIARQLRLRDLGGLLVIDFIDMNSNRNQREVETCLREATKADRARIQIGKISRFGLLEMSRQRLGASLRETSAINCPRCDGQGTIRTVESLALYILRLIEDEANKERTARISVQVPVAVATFLFNEKRDILADLDKRLGMQALILPNPNLETPHYDIQRTRVQDLNKTLADTPSFDLPIIDEETHIEQPGSKPVERPAVTPAVRVSPPQQEAKKEKGVLAKMFGWLGGQEKVEPTNPTQPTKSSRPNKRPPRSGDSRSRNQDNRGSSKRGDSRRSQGNKQDNQSNRQGGTRNTQNDKNEPAEQREARQSTKKEEGQRESSRSSNRRGNRGGRGNRNSGESRQTDDNKTRRVDSPTSSPEAADNSVQPKPDQDQKVQRPASPEPFSPKVSGSDEHSRSPASENPSPISAPSATSITAAPTTPAKTTETPLTSVASTPEQRPLDIATSPKPDSVTRSAQLVAVEPTKQNKAPPITEEPGATVAKPTKPIAEKPVAIKSNNADSVHTAKKPAEKFSPKVSKPIAGQIETRETDKQDEVSKTPV